MVALPVAYLVIKIYKTSFSIKKREEKRRKNPPTAVFVAAVLPVAYLVIRIYKISVSIKKKEKNPT